MIVCGVENVIFFSFWILKTLNQHCNFYCNVWSLRSPLKMQIKPFLNISTMTCAIMSAIYRLYFYVCQTMTNENVGLMACILFNSSCNIIMDMEKSTKIMRYHSSGLVAVMHLPVSCHVPLKLKEEQFRTAKFIVFLHILKPSGVFNHEINK